MSVIDAYVARIQAEAGSFETVEKARTTKPIEDYAARLPAALVYLARVESDQNGLDIGVRQEKQITVGVLMVCETKDIETLRAELEAALMGWTPATGDDLVEHDNGEMVVVQGRVSWWRETFAHRTWTNA